MTPLAQGQFFERLAIATGLGLAIGVERQWRQRTAGLHTTTIVAVGAALFTAAPELLGISDGLRLVGQVITGIGFLAGGVILREGFNVRGLVTAATLWSTAAVGSLAGTGLVFQAAVGAATIIAVNLFGMPLAALIAGLPRPGSEHLETVYTLRVSCADDVRDSVRTCIIRTTRTTPLVLSSMSAGAPANGILDFSVELTKSGGDDGAADRLKIALENLPGVTSARIDVAERPL